MIKLTNVNKVYGKGDSSVHALKDVNLELPSGKFIAIVGKSGSGKSTLMNIVGALDSCTSGTVEIDGEVLNNKSANQLADYRNRKIGYIFQSFYLEPTFTVLENVAMPMTIAGMKRKEREAKAMEAIASLNLLEKANKKASELSGGQKQRVSIARALVFDPDIILADEPTGNLDSQNGQEVIALLQKICDSGKTVLLVTHNIDDARKTDMMVEIKDGVISNIIENDEATKKAAQHASDYDADGNLIEKPAQENVAKSSDDGETTQAESTEIAQDDTKLEQVEPTQVKSVVVTTTDNVVSDNVVNEGKTENKVESSAKEESASNTNLENEVVVDTIAEKAEAKKHNAEIAMDTIAESEILEDVVTIAIKKQKSTEKEIKAEKVAPKPKIVKADKSSKPKVVKADKASKPKVVNADKATKPAVKKVEKVGK